VRHAIFVPNFGVFSDPVLVSDLARRAESAGFDGWFLWDHVVHRDGDEPAADPWITLAAVATSTSRTGSARWSPRYPGDVRGTSPVRLPPSTT
jgi:alkanesulfonate monooxygenase SsuD/methylene tetrahydromethanopterin reductase-like flavin-dependent oxidoreductase (luciferase family)